MNVDPGEGWRLLNVGERVEEGDQYLDERECWQASRASGVECSPKYLLPHRRRLPAAMADAVHTSGGSLAWIPVTERLPEELQTVLVVIATPSGSHVSFMSRHPQAGFWEHPDGDIDDINVTHWMPLPAPPTGVIVPLYRLPTLTDAERETVNVRHELGDGVIREIRNDIERLKRQVSLLINDCDRRAGRIA